MGPAGACHSLACLLPHCNLTRLRGWGAEERRSTPTAAPISPSVHGCGARRFVLSSCCALLMLQRLLLLLLLLLPQNRSSIQSRTLAPESGHPRQPLLLLQQVLLPSSTLLSPLLSCSRSCSLALAPALLLSRQRAEQSALPLLPRSSRSLSLFSLSLSSFSLSLSLIPPQSHAKHESGTYPCGAQAVRSP